MNHQPTRKDIERLAALATEAKRRIEIRACERGTAERGPLHEFVRQHWHILEPVTPLVEDWPLEAMCAHLEAVARGEITRLLENVPPGSMKSLLLNVFFPAWLWGPMRMAHIRILSFSYAAHLTERDNGKFRDLICHADYQRKFGDRFKITKAGEVKVGNDKTGWKIASSVGGVSTGERADIVCCLPYDSPILTSEGWLKIGDVVTSRLPVLVAGCDDSGTVSWQQIEAYEHNPARPIFEIVFDGGRLHCTGEHPVFVEGQGYVRADQIQEGQILRAIRAIDLPELQGRDKTQAKRTAEVLFIPVQERGPREASSRATQSPMRHLWRNGLSAPSPSQAHAGAAILQPCLSWHLQSRAKQFCVSLWQGFVKLSAMRKAVSRKSIHRQASQFLFKALLWGASDKAVHTSADARLRNVSEDFQGPARQDPLLFRVMRRLGAFSADEGGRQRPVYARGGDAAVSAGLESEVQGSDPRSRWSLLQGLWHARGRWAAGAPHSPYRLCEGKSGSVEFDHSLQVLPRVDARAPEPAGRLAAKVVRSVRCLGNTEPSTFNIRVGPHHNYFASGVLVHNCDDPHNVKQGESDVIRTGTVEWFGRSMSNRLNDMQKSAIVVVMQRVHEADVSGYILSNPNLGYTHLCIPAEFDGRRCRTSIGYEDPRTVMGEIFWPARFPAEVLARQKTELGPFQYPAQYQQLAVPAGGGILKAEWWQTWDEEAARHYRVDLGPGGKLLFPAFQYIVASLDTAYTEAEENDPSAMTVWGVWKDRYGVLRVMLITAWNEHLEFPELVDRVAATCAKYRISRILIEAKSAGHSVAQELRKRWMTKAAEFGMNPRTRDRGDFGIELVTPNGRGHGKGDKVARAHSVVPLLAAGLVFAPDTERADEVIQQCASFPKGAHDDLVDTVTQALAHLRSIGLAVLPDERDLAAALDAMPPSQSASAPLYPV